MTKEPDMTNTDLIERLAKRGRIPEGGMFTDTMAACLDAKARIGLLEVEVVRLYGNAKANNMLARHETAGRKEAAAALTEANAKLVKAREGLRDALSIIDTLGKQIDDAEMWQENHVPACNLRATLAELEDGR